MLVASSLFQKHGTEVSVALWGIVCSWRTSLRRLAAALLLPLAAQCCRAGHKASGRGSASVAARWLPFSQVNHGVVPGPAAATPAPPAVATTAAAAVKAAAASKSAATAPAFLPTAAAAPAFLAPAAAAAALLPTAAAKAPTAAAARLAAAPWRFGGRHKDVLAMEFGAVEAAGGLQALHRGQVHVGKALRADSGRVKQF